jgi:TRAP transporter TAXI family solute receptor
MKIRFALSAASLAFVGLAAQPALAADPKLPQTMAWSAYDVGSSGYNQSVAIGAAFKNRYGTNLRVIPGKNDVSRLLPLKTGKLDYVVNGVGTYMGQEGLYEFGAKDWGPMPLRILMTSVSGQSLSVIAAKDSGVKTVADLKGKRVAWVIGSPALNQNVTAILAFAGLDWDDVQKVEFGGYGASLDALVNGQADAAFGTSISGKAYALAKSPRGLVYPPLPASDTEGWKRVQEIGPFFVPVKMSEGPDVSATNTVESAAYPYPILTTLPDRKSEDVHAMVQAMVETYDLYKDAAPGNNGWALDRQVLSWVVPYHDGAIRFFKEKGLWTAANQQHHDRLLARQKVLGEAWKKVSAQNLDEAAHMAAWQKERAAALKAAGMPVVLESW